MEMSGLCFLSRAFPPTSLIGFWDALATGGHGIIFLQPFPLFYRLLASSRYDARLGELSFSLSVLILRGKVFRVVDLGARSWHWGLDFL